VLRALAGGFAVRRAAIFGLAIASLVAVRPHLAHAGGGGSSCGGGGGSSGGSSGSSGGSSGGAGASSSYGDSGSSSTTACVDSTDIVGYRQCTHYGKWASNLRFPNLILEIGMVMREFASPLGARNGSVTHDDETFAFRVVEPTSSGGAAPRDPAMAFALRLGVGLPSHLYLAVDGEFGVAGDDARATMLDSGVRGSPTIRPTSVTLLGGDVALGIAGRAGHLTLGAEVAGGGRTLMYNYASTYGACEQKTSILATTGVVEARVRGGWWFTPFAQLGMTAGKSLIDDSWMGGVFLNAQSHAFGGR